MDRMAEIEIGRETADPCERARLRISVSGIVQGVGFRPFIYRIAHRETLAGFVLNNPQGVEIEVEGELRHLSAFLTAVVNEKPVQARIDTMTANFVDNRNDTGFIIEESSASAERTTLISPDIATCRDCLGELGDAGDRRYRYPFTNCTNCGPRYTIIRSVPYDRKNTTMSVFELCPDCAREYTDPMDRRFHAEPNACPVCGPEMVLKDSGGAVVDCEDPVAAAIGHLARGKVVAVKGLGGFHLAADATNEEAVSALRRRKQREEKPLAIMSASVETVRTYAEVSETEEAVLTGPERPIVLLRKKPSGVVAEAVAPGNKYVGVMLPYTPVHHMLLATGLIALVMTSGNISEEPIAIDIEDAVARLGDVADYYLDHNREILCRCDDSVVRVIDGQMLFSRRSRGFVPLPVGLEEGGDVILACGAHLKNTVALTRKNQVFPSQHVGDLENLEAYEFFKSTVVHMEDILEVEPQVVAHDLHPDYLSTQFARELAGPKKIAVQHHHAHIASCLGEAGLEGPVIGFSLDGTGYGPDGTVWGGEILVATRGGFRRAGHIETVHMPGGERAVREPWRMALSHVLSALEQGELDSGVLKPGEEALAKLLGRPRDEVRLVRQALEKKINCPVTSSCGRLFDAVSALCGVRGSISFEGQAAIELEMILDESEGGGYPAAISEDGPMIIRTAPLIAAIVRDLNRGADPGRVSARFHNWLVYALHNAAVRLREKENLQTVALSGGCFQNAYLLQNLKMTLESSGFNVIINRLVPANDGGISFGQVVVARALLGADERGDA
jgi:hydrogenase maturation protein HypF